MSLQNTAPTAELRALDAAHHIHPFTDTKVLNRNGARVITRADGVYLWDSDGNQILDGMSGLWCVNVGYGRNEISDAIARQSRQLPYYNTFFQTSHPPAIELAELLSEITPDGFNRVFYTSSGSEANDTVVRLVRHYWSCQGEPERHVIISRENAYHGSTMASASLGGMRHMHAQGGLPIPGIEHIGQPYWYREGADTTPEAFGLVRAAELEAAIERIGPERVAAFIAEPVQGAGGVVIPPPTYWPEIQRVCRKYGVLLVVDEVICGFGRTGHWFGIEHFDIEPDLLVFAKGVTSGYLPLGGVMLQDHVAETLIEHGGEFAHGFTYSGHPTACAAAIANLTLMREERLIERVRDDTAPYFARRWRELAAHPLVGEARTCGMLAALELSADKATRAPFAAKAGTVGLLARELCFRRGVVLRNVYDTMVAAPPLCITPGEIDELIEKTAQSLDGVVTGMEVAGIS